jgi:hypothetical protein
MQEAVKSLLLRRLALVVVDESGRVIFPQARVERLRERARTIGYDFSPELAARLLSLQATQLHRFENWLMPLLQSLKGAGVPHQTLFPNFADRAAPNAGAEAPRWVVLHLCADPADLLGPMVASWLSRQTPLPPDERADLLLLLHHYRDDFLALLPREIPVRETVALLFGSVLRELLSSKAPAERMLAVWEYARPLLKSATDVLRLLTVSMGGDEGFCEKLARRRSLPRGLRRAVLLTLQSFDARSLVEDMSRYSVRWKGLGEVLHPFEEQKRAPQVAAAFAVLRQTKLKKATPFVQRLRRAAAKVSTLDTSGRRLRLRGWGSLLEIAFRQQDAPLALTLLAQRPGELMRRHDHLLRTIDEAGPDLSVELEALREDRLGQVSAPVLLTSLAHFRARGARLGARIFFPKGNIGRVKSLKDRRRPLPERLTGPLCEQLERELLARAGALPRFSRAVLDVGLGELLVPTREKVASESLVAIPRGSRLPLPAGDSLRLFLRWTEPPGERTDLDLSVAFFDAEWNYLGLCDFTQLSYGNGAAQHSGDFTSAPNGASEFVDLRVEKLRALGVRHAVMCVFSFNAVSFEDLPEGFAGFLTTPAKGELFDAARVEQRFDLRSEALFVLPMVVDLQARRSLWLDLVLVGKNATDSYHSVDQHLQKITTLGKSLTEYYSANTRPTLWELACLHAAARTPEVHARWRDRSVTVFRRREDEDPHAFSRRLAYLDAPDAERVALDEASEPVLAALLRDDIPLPKESNAYVLDWRTLSAAEVSRLTASDLLAALAR